MKQGKSVRSVIFVAKDQIPAEEQLIGELRKIAAEKNYPSCMAHVVCQSDGYEVIVCRAMIDNFDALQTIYPAGAVASDVDARWDSTNYPAMQRLAGQPRLLLPQFSVGGCELVEVSIDTPIPELATLLFVAVEQGAIAPGCELLLHLGPKYAELYNHLSQAVAHYAELYYTALEKVKSRAEAIDRKLGQLYAPEILEYCALSTVHTAFYANLGQVGRENNEYATYLTRREELNCKSINYSSTGLDYYWFDDNDVIGPGQAQNIRINFFGQYK